MASLRPNIRGAGNRQRFDYWLNQFQYLRAIGKLNCLWGQFNAAVEKLKQEKDPQARRQLAQQSAFPLRRQMVEQLAEVHRHLLASVSTWGGLGNVTNWQQHIMPMLLDDPAKTLESLLESPLPDELKRLPVRYAGPPRIFVPTVRSHLVSGERWSMRIIVLSSQKPADVELHLRPLGRGEYRVIVARHVARGVYRVALPPADDGGWEYYITANIGHRQHKWPATAPRLNGTTVTIPQ